MNWLQEAFLEPTMVQAVIIISLVSALGLYLGRIKIFGISLGITFVFFAGILAGHLGIVVNKDMLYLRKVSAWSFLFMHWDCRWARVFSLP